VHKSGWWCVHFFLIKFNIDFSDIAGCGSEKDSLRRLHTCAAWHRSTSTGGVVWGAHGLGRGSQCELGLKMDRDTGAGVTTTQNPLRSLQTPRRRRNTPVVPGPGTAGTPVTPTTTDAARPRACTGESISEDERALFSGHQRVSSCNSLAELVSSGAADTSKEAMNRDFHVNLGAVVREYGPHVQPPNWKTFLLRKPEWCAQVGCCTRYLRHKVSRKKKRFVRDGFDLDLTYVAPRIIAMGYPSSGVEYLYRNPRHEVLRFFRERHWGHYKVYNLCSETGRQYSSALFHGSYSPCVRAFVSMIYVPHPYCGCSQRLVSIPRPRCTCPATHVLGM